MIMFDTNYQSLADIDPEIVRFYAEDTRQRVIGWDEDKEEQIKESYTVIVLVKPEVVFYHDVEQRRSERKPFDVVRDEIERAIAWEDFDINHDKYLLWKYDFATWQTEQPHEDVWDEEAGEFVSKLVDGPERPQIDESKRVECYEKITEQFDANLCDFSGEYSESVNHEERTVTRIPVVTSKPSNEIAVYHRKLAVEHREKIKFSDIFVHGHYFQVCKNALHNMNETLSYAERHGALNQSTTWITANNEVVTLTYHQIQTIKDAYVMRMDDLFSQFKAWSEGGMQQPFKFVKK